MVACQHLLACVKTVFAFFWQCMSLEGRYTAVINLRICETANVFFGDVTEVMFSC